MEGLNKNLIDKEKTSSLEKENLFSGLDLRNEYGEAHLPFNAKIANLEGTNIDQSFSHPNLGEYRLCVNKEQLNGYLIEVGSASVFYAMDRVFVVAKVGNIHLPFFISSGGTGGKNAGEWYPFFGLSQGWLVKTNLSGEFGDGNKMIYHSEITKVNELLNENLVLPMNIFDDKGVLYSDIETVGNKINLKDVIGFKNYIDDESDIAVNRSIEDLEKYRDYERETGLFKIVLEYLRESKNMELNNAKNEEEKKKIIEKYAGYSDARNGYLNIIGNLNHGSESNFIRRVTGFLPGKEVYGNKEVIDNWVRSIISKI